jgi:hypothetical protein
MRTITRIPLENGGSILVETEPAPSTGGLTRVSRPDGLVQEAKEKLETALAGIKPVAAAVMNTLKDINSPSEIEVEFGVKLSAEANVILSSTTMEGHFKITLTWKKAGTPDS